MHKSIINTIKTIAAVAMTLTAAIVPAACTDELYNAAESTTAPEGKGELIGPFSLTIPLGTSISEVRSRSTFDTNDFQVNEAWVGIFDATSGLIIGSSKKSFNGQPLNPSHNTSMGNDYNMTFKNLFINDDNSTVYIVGVANFRDIKAYCGNDTLIKYHTDAQNIQLDLETVLDSVRTFEQYMSIAVNTATAEKAVQDKNAPLMSGVFANGHTNFTFDTDKKPNSNTAAIELFDKATRKVNTLTGLVHLRRLVDHINVTVTVGSGITFENPTFQLYNLPRTTFLQEKTLVQNAGAYTRQDWNEKYTASSSNYVHRHSVREGKESIYVKSFEFGGYTDMTNAVGVGESYIDTEDAGFFMSDADKMVLSNGNRTIKFGYWHFENKHWGLPSCTSLYDREERYGNSDVFASLSPSMSEPYNNEATYMVIRGKISDPTNGYYGNAEFVIHEGYSCTADGSQASDLAVASRDFATFRNTNYTYDIQINGLKDIVVKVTTDDFQKHNPGAGGEIWSTKAENIDVPNKDATVYKTGLTEGPLYWCIQTENGSYFGKKLDDVNSPYFSAFPASANISEAMPADNSFFNGITLNGKSLYGYNVTAEEASSLENELIIPANNGNDNILYLCRKVVSKDGTTTYYTVSRFTQEGSKLDAPEIFEFPEVTTGTFLVGQQRNVVRWSSVNGATQYVFRIQETGYEVTLNASDLTTDSDGYLTYTVPYAESRNGLMAITHNSNATFAVAASNGTKTSNFATFSKKVVLPRWDFSDSDWKNYVTSNFGAQPVTFPANTMFTINGLTMSGGGDEKTKYMASSNYSYFTFGGTGHQSGGKREFRFRAVAKGKLVIETSSNGSSAGTGRYMIVSFNDGSQKTSSDPGYNNKDANASKNGVKTTLTMTNIDAPDYQTVPLGSNNITVYPYQDLLIYSIKFTPEDR